LLQLQLLRNEAWQAKLRLASSAKAATPSTSTNTSQQQIRGQGLYLEAERLLSPIGTGLRGRQVIYALSHLVRSTDVPSRGSKDNR